MLSSASQARGNGAFATIKRLYDRFVGPILNGRMAIVPAAPEAPAEPAPTTTLTNSGSTD